MGNDFLGPLLTAMHWGDQWCDENTQPVTVVHTTCGATIHAVMACDHCSQPVVPRQVTFDRLPQAAQRPQGQVARTRKPGLDLLERQQPCSIARTLQVIGEQWSSLIIQECFFGTHRFDDFQNRLAIASNILSQRLARLTERGVLTARSTDSERGYYLTDKGTRPLPGGPGDADVGRPLAVRRKAAHRAHHTACGRRLRATAVCSHCGEQLLVGELQFRAAAAAAARRAHHHRPPQARDHRHRHGRPSPPSHPTAGVSVATSAWGVFRRAPDGPL